MPGPTDVARWVGHLGEEAVRAPTTIRRARLGLGQIETLGTRINDLIDALDRTTSTLESILPELADGLRHVDAEMSDLSKVIIALKDDISSVLLQTTSALDQVLPEVARVMAAMDDRVGHLDRVVSDLGDTLSTVIGAIPGVRRALKTTRTAGD
jgi:ABC-type transporter Mla subunit MlaD